MLYKRVDNCRSLHNKSNHSSSPVMLLTPVIFSFLALQLPQVFGQTFCNGGILPCVQNAECDAASDTCQCSSGFSGNGRVSCNPSTTRCTCTALADPRFGLFDTQAAAQAVTANLPCSVRLVRSFFQATPSPCLIGDILAHPETRGSGVAANLRVFVKEVEVKLLLPATTFIVDSSGTTVTSGAANVASSVNSDSYNVATVASCSNLEVGFNGTYGGAYVNSVAGDYSGTPAFCGDCDNVADELVGASNTTNLGYFMKYLAPTADQKGTYASQCGAIQGIVEGACSDAELDLVGDVCGRYLDSFGICLIEDPMVTSVPDFATLLTTKVLPCVTAICATGSATAQCTALTGDESAACKVGTLPTSCP